MMSNIFRVILYAIILYTLYNAYNTITFESKKIDKIIYISSYIFQVLGYVSLFIFRMKYNEQDFKLFDINSKLNFVFNKGYYILVIIFIVSSVVFIITVTKLYNKK